MDTRLIQTFLVLAEFLLILIYDNFLNGLR